MKYKVRDKVKIKGLDWYYSNSDCMGKVNCGDFDFTTLQTSYCGKILEISSVCDGFYIMKGVGHHWTDDMIEGLADETEPQEKMVSLEKVEEWLYKNFYESYNLNDYGKYDLDEPYITSSFDTINEMFDDLRKTMEE